MYLTAGPKNSTGVLSYVCPAIAVNAVCAIVVPALVAMWALLSTGAWGSWRKEPKAEVKDDLEEDTIFG